MTPSTFLSYRTEREKPLMRLLSLNDGGVIPCRCVDTFPSGLTYDQPENVHLYTFHQPALGSISKIKVFF
jgi:hypothetical protein